MLIFVCLNGLVHFAKSFEGEFGSIYASCIPIDSTCVSLKSKVQTCAEDVVLQLLSYTSKPNHLKVRVLFKVSICSHLPRLVCLHWQVKYTDLDAWRQFILLSISFDSAYLRPSLTLSVEYDMIIVRNDENKAVVEDGGQIETHSEARHVRDASPTIFGHVVLEALWLVGKGACKTSKHKDCPLAF